MERNRKDYKDWFHLLIQIDSLLKSIRDYHTKSKMRLPSLFICSIYLDFLKRFRYIFAKDP